MQLLNDTLGKIGPLNEEVTAQVQDKLNNLIKPPGSLGAMEKIAMQVAGITGNPSPVIGRKAVILMGGDHGICEEKVTGFPSIVTGIMMDCFAKGIAGINVLSRQVGADVIPVDVGVMAPVENPAVVNKNVRRGTANMAQGPAMTREEAVRAVEIGIALAIQEIEKGANLLATGDMGIGNTSPSSALLAVFGSIPIEEVTGIGTGNNDELMVNKNNALKSAIEVNKPDPNDPIDTLAKVGGLEIAALAGVILGAAAARVPIIIDGFISTAAALVASRILPQSVSYMIPSHCSAEKAHRQMLDLIGLKPVLEMEMRLGEGTGAVLLMPVIEASTKLLREMATFKDIGF